jgi:hypothetical protein
MVWPSKNLNDPHICSRVKIGKSRSQNLSKCLMPGIVLKYWIYKKVVKVSSCSCPGLETKGTRLSVLPRSYSYSIFKKSWTRPFSNFSRSLVLGLVANNWSCRSVQIIRLQEIIGLFTLKPYLCKKYLLTPAFHKYYFFVDLKPHFEFKNLSTTSCGRKVTVGEREKKSY